MQLARKLGWGEGNRWRFAHRSRFCVHCKNVSCCPDLNLHREQLAIYRISWVWSRFYIQLFFAPTWTLISVKQSPVAIRIRHCLDLKHIYSLHADLGITYDNFFSPSYCPWYLTQIYSSFVIFWHYMFKSDTKNKFELLICAVIGRELTLRRLRFVNFPGRDISGGRKKYSPIYISEGLCT